MKVFDLTFLMCLFAVVAGVSSHHALTIRWVGLSVMLIGSGVAGWAFLPADNAGLHVCQGRAGGCDFSSLGEKL